MGLMFWTLSCTVYSLYSVTLVLILMSNSHGQEITEQSCLEGDDVVLRFTANTKQSICNFTLDLNGLVFSFNGERIISISFRAAEKHHRIRVYSNITLEEYLIFIAINKTHRLDAGNYTCVYHCTNTTYLQVRGLTIFYPPRLSQCALNRSLISLPPKMFRDYSILQCSFWDGYPSGYATCYAGNIEQTDLIAPFDISYTGIMKNAIFLIERETDVSCCVLNQKFMKSQEDCNDFQIQIYSSSIDSMPTKDILLQDASSSSSVSAKTPLSSKSAEISEQIFSLTQGLGTLSSHRASTHTFPIPSSSSYKTSTAIGRDHLTKKFVIIIIAAVGAGILLTSCLFTAIGIALYRHMLRRHFKTSNHSNENNEEETNQQHEDLENYETIYLEVATYEDPLPPEPPPRTNELHSNNSSDSDSRPLEHVEHEYFEGQSSRNEDIKEDSTGSYSNKSVIEKQKSMSSARMSQYHLLVSSLIETNIV